MAEFPETRDSLLLRIRNPADAVAWDRFVSGYRPAVHRLALRCGLQDADADDLAQQVMATVVRAIGDWRKDSSRGTFRGWLTTVTRNACLNALTRRPAALSKGGTSVAELLERHPQEGDALSALIEQEYQRFVFRHAADAIQPEFHELTWSAFWMTTVEGMSVDEASESLGKSIGAVYAARSRVMRRIKEVIDEMES